MDTVNNNEEHNDMDKKLHISDVIISCPECGCDYTYEYIYASCLCTSQKFFLFHFCLKLLVIYVLSWVYVIHSIAFLYQEFFHSRI